MCQTGYRPPVEDKQEEPTMKISRVGVDLAKNVFQIHGSDNNGKAIWKRKLTRDKWINAICASVPEGCEIGMEACAGAHHWPGN